MTEQLKNSKQLCCECDTLVTEEDKTKHIFRKHLLKPMFMCPRCDFSSTHNYERVLSHMKRMDHMRKGALSPLPVASRYEEDIAKWNEICWSRDVYDAVSSSSLSPVKLNTSFNEEEEIEDDNDIWEIEVDPASKISETISTRIESETFKIFVAKKEKELNDRNETVVEICIQDEFSWVAGNNGEEAVPLSSGPFSSNTTMPDDESTPLKRSWKRKTLKKSEKIKVAPKKLKLSPRLSKQKAKKVVIESDDSEELEIILNNKIKKLDKSKKAKTVDSDESDYSPTNKKIKKSDHLKKKAISIKNDQSEDNLPNKKVKISDNSSTKAKKSDAYCYECKKRIGQNRMRHLIREHLKKPLFECSNCGYSSWALHHLQRHVKQRKSCIGKTFVDKTKSFSKELNELEMRCYSDRRNEKKPELLRRKVAMESVCSLCKTTIASIKQKMHIYEMHLKVVNLFQCKLCSFKSSHNELSVHYHAKRAHGDFSAVSSRTAEYVTQISEMEKLCFKPKKNSGTGWHRQWIQCAKCSAALKNCDRRKHVLREHVRIKDMFACLHCDYMNAYDRFIVIKHNREVHKAGSEIKSRQGEFEDNIDAATLRCFPPAVDDEEEAAE